MDGRGTAGDCERSNLDEIERLNQRGGRTLSAVDLIADGTLTAEMAAFCAMVVEHGSSLLTGAVPGGAGKTTLMATLLSFLPVGERIVIVDSPRVLEQKGGSPPAQPTTLLAHEIGSGRWYGYLWGRDAVEFFRLAGRGFRCVSCLHADSPAEAADALAALGLRDEDWQRIGLQLYMHVSGGWGQVTRRVSGVHCRLGGELRRVFHWDGTADRFEADVPRGEAAALLAEDLGCDAAAVSARWRAYEELVTGMMAEDLRLFEAVRRRIATASGARLDGGLRGTDRLR